MACGAIKSAVAARLVKRLERIESGANGWQGCAWLTERLLPTRVRSTGSADLSLNTETERVNSPLRGTHRSVAAAYTDRRTSVRNKDSGISDFDIACHDNKTNQIIFVHHAAFDIRELFDRLTGKSQISQRASFQHDRIPWRPVRARVFRVFLAREIGAF